MATDADITVVMATFNGERFIKSQLESIEQQDLKPAEVIISDDRSTDRTIEIVKAFMINSKLNIKLIENSNRLGYSENFLTAAKMARSPILSFCDQDDIWRPEKLRVCIEALKNHQADLCVHTAEIVDDDDRLIGKFGNLITATRVYGPQSYPLAPWRTYAGFTMVLRKEMLEMIAPEERGISYINADKPLAHDGWVYFLASNLGTIVTLDKSLAFYRQHQSNHSGPLPVGMMKRFSRSAGDAYHPDRRLAEVSQHWSVILNNYCERSTGNERTIARRAAELWDKAHQLESDRVSVYTSAKRIARLNKFFKIFHNHYYSFPNRKNLSIGLMLKDFIVGVLQLRTLKG